MAGAMNLLARSATGEREPGCMLTVMTFNLRYDNAGDGENAWPHRREAAAALIRAHSPDLLGTQEGLAPQLEELQARLPGYAAHGRSRADPRQDEHCRVFYRTATLRLRRHGDFWLSETPEVIGSITAAWGNTMPRMVTWGEFEPVGGGAPFTFVNTHLDHASPLARERAAAQIVRFLRELSVIQPVIVGGDLNSVPGSLPLKILTGEVPVDDAASPLRDSYCLAGGTGEGRATFHGFTGRGEERIDYLLVDPRFRVTQCDVLEAPVEGRWVSDHFPVVAALDGP
jgi:endonuclease/exonuclease/phosphatase family metal-dependent hydrolase